MDRVIDSVCRAECGMYRAALLVLGDRALVWGIERIRAAIERLSGFIERIRGGIEHMTGFIERITINIEHMTKFIERILKMHEHLLTLQVRY
ncbi:hypothetical protein CSV72_11715 [Sporosarcina sp. P20a]|nr:hypothetical protein CSV72_11715 [Sporosarcina sp. P20a]